MDTSSYGCLAADQKKGILNPFPLLLPDGGRPHKPRGPCNLVNPFLLVTERKGLAYSVHYGAFPLDAFHTDGEVLIILAYSKHKHCLVRGA